uniref:Chemokine interleukin-8-like domain-containing protein n=1 Tax=Scleropages formosus TaxID=113540 RepID=A0A8C9S887_SCLFO
QLAAPKRSFLSLTVTAAVESTFVPTRCMCPQTSKVIRHATDFVVYKKGVHCSSDEIVMTLKTGEQQCLSAQGQQGRRLMQCWDRVNETGGDKKKCLKIKRNRTKNKRQKKRPTS